MMLGSTENSISQRSSHQSRLQPQINKTRNQEGNLAETIFSHLSS